MQRKNENESIEYLISLKDKTFAVNNSSVKSINSFKLCLFKKTKRIKRLCATKSFENLHTVFETVLIVLILFSFRYIVSISSVSES